MKCNFQRRIVRRDNKKIIRELAAEAACDQLSDIAERAQYLWMAAMLNAGLSVRTIKRVQKQLDYVNQQYGAAVEDGVGDATLLRDLRSAGLDVKDPENEI